MSPHKLTGFVTALAFAARLHAAESGNAKDAPADKTGTNSPTALSVRLKGEETIGNQQIHRAYISSGTNQFAFAIPPDFRVDASNPEQMAVANSDLSILITVHFIDPQPGVHKELSLDACRDLVLNRYPGATILAEFSLSAAGRSGPAFELSRTNSGGAAERVRIAFIPSRAGQVEFALTASPEKFVKGKYFFDFLMLSFRSNESGQLEIGRYSDRL